MKLKPFPLLRVGIMLRTALLSWLVTIITVAVFAAVIIPLQKRTFIENLESKAHSVIVSLREVAAGAAVSEDYSSVVDHSKGMLNGDETLAYVVFTKNDGFSLIHDRSGWRVEENVSKEWRPDMRKTVGEIRVSPIVNHRVFHLSQPFDYSGIEWGWIHVGLSLDAYDRSVSMVYRRTAILAAICILIGLLASTWYAQRLVQPILSLRTIVRDVASGNLSVRASIERSDELGSLAGSVNLMTEALLRRDKILQSVRFAAQQFLGTIDWRTVIEGVLAKLGEASAASRIQVYQNQSGENAVGSGPILEWTALNTKQAFSSLAGKALAARRNEFSAWADRLRSRERICCLTSELNPGLRETFEHEGIKSLMIIPILVGQEWWGVVKLDDCQNDRQWSPAEQDSIQAAADMFGAAIARQRIQDALVEANDTLEQRVTDRTKELQEQVVAKERAHAELADAQHRLLEASRQAGMAEVATGVLHNVGNVLNSVNVSSTLLREQLHRSEVSTLVRLGKLLKEHEADLVGFLTADPKGKLVPRFVLQLTEVIDKEHTFLLNELDQMGRNVEHIKDIVAMQQGYAKVSGFREKVFLSEIANDALRISGAALSRHNIKVTKDYADAPAALVDKHKVMQILVNLIQNGRIALTEANNQDRELRIQIRVTDDAKVSVTVADNGIGIPADNLTRIFSHGFTTRKNGHGFGLHSGANAAREMGGSLRVHSDGLGKGAAFTLELPLTAEQEHP